MDRRARGGFMGMKGATISCSGTGAGGSGRLAATS